MNRQTVVKVIGITANGLILLFSLANIAQEGIPSLRFLLFFVLAPLLALLAFMLPLRMAQLQLALLWPAGILITMGSALSFIGSGFLLMPLAVITLMVALYQTVTLPTPLLDWLIILPAAFLSWLALLAKVNFGTLKAINWPAALALALIFLVFIVARRGSRQNLLLVAVLIILLSPLTAETLASYIDFGFKENYSYFEPMARQIIYDHPKFTDEQLTQLFEAEARKRLRHGEEFSALIKREGKSAYVVSWQVEVRGQRGYSGGFFVGQPATQKSPIIINFPPEKLKK